MTRPKSSAPGDTPATPLVPWPVSGTDTTLVPQIGPVTVIPLVVDCCAIDVGLKCAASAGTDAFGASVTAPGDPVHDSVKSVAVGVENPMPTALLPVFVTVRRMSGALLLTGTCPKFAVYGVSVSVPPCAVSWTGTNDAGFF